MGLHIIYSITNMSTSRLLIRKKNIYFFWYEVVGRLRWYEPVAFWYEVVGTLVRTGSFLVRSGRLRSGHGTKCLETV